MKRRTKGYICLSMAVLFAVLTVVYREKYLISMASASILFDLLTLNYIFLEKIFSEAKKKLSDRFHFFMEVFAGIVILATKKTVGIFKRIAAKLSLSGGRGYRGSNLAKGYYDYSEKIEKGKVARVKRKRKRYKNMDNREKIRYLYDRKLTEAEKKGAAFTGDMTPLETEAVMLEKRYMSEKQHIIIAGYNEARYNDEAQIGDEMVDMVKKSLDNP